MARPGSSPEWSEASAGRIANFRQVYRESVENSIEDEKAEREEARDTTGASLPPRPFRTIPPWRRRDTDKADKWKHSAGLRFTGTPRSAEEENLSMRHSHVLAASFAPQRHLRFVLGRPVLVPLIFLFSVGRLRIYHVGCLGALFFVDAHVCVLAHVWGLSSMLLRKSKTHFAHGIICTSIVGTAFQDSKLFCVLFSLLAVQVLVTTHELVKTERADQYLAAKMAPIVPLMLYGRSARAAPTCPPGECLWYTWRDRSPSDKTYVT